jgi:hypothetical protein
MLRSHDPISRGIAVAARQVHAAGIDSPQETPPRTPSFISSRSCGGMAVAVVIETRDWYLGLVQAAQARVRLEGDN